MNKLYLIITFSFLLGCLQDKEEIKNTTIELEKGTFNNNLDIGSQNYFNSVPRLIRETIPFDMNYNINEKNINLNKIKSIKSKYYYSKDTTIKNFEFDEFGNLIQESYNNETKYSYKYEFDSLERIVQKNVFEQNNRILQTNKFHYDSSSRIDFVLTNFKNGSDSILFEYDSYNNIIKANNKTLKYDKKGNCIEWTLKLEGPSCGNTTTHWKGEYNTKGELIDSWSNTDYLYPNINFHREYVNDSLFSSDGKLISIETHDETGEVIAEEHFQYF